MELVIFFILWYLSALIPLCLIVKKQYKSWNPHYIHATEELKETIVRCMIFSLAGPVVIVPLILIYLGRYVRDTIVKLIIEK